MAKRTRDRTRRVIQDYLRILRDAGVILKFRTLVDSGRVEHPEEGEGPIQVAMHGSDFHIAPDDERTILYPYYNACCRKPGGLALRVASWDNPAVITLGDNIFHFYRTSEEYGKRDSYKFVAKYVRSINSRC